VQAYNKLLKRTPEHSVVLALSVIGFESLVKAPFSRALGASAYLYTFGNYRMNKQHSPSVNTSSIVCFIVTLLLLISGYDSVYLVPEGHVAYTITNRSINGSKLQSPGLNIKIPFFQRVAIFKPYNSGVINVKDKNEGSKYKVDFFYVIADAHLRTFYLSTEGWHGYIKTALAIRLSEKLSSNSPKSLIEVQKLVLEAFSEYNLGFRSEEMKDSFFSSTKIDITKVAK
jgi:hypothetical protein